MRDKDVFHDILEPALAALLRSRPGKVKLRLLGEFGDFRHLDPDDPSIEVVTPIWDFESYLDILATVDINLSILALSPDTDAKSEIKWSEAALFGIPSVVSPTATMTAVIADGRTGILCTTSDDYATALTALVDQPHRRAAIGAAAQAGVLQSYGTATLGQSLKSVFDRLRPDAPRKPKLLIVNVFYPPQAIGGATRVVHDNVTDLHQRYAADFDIEVLCTLEGGRTPYEVTVSAKGGVRVWAITAANGAATMTAQDPLMGDAFSRVIDEIGPDLIHFHCIQRLTAAVVDVARSRHIPYVITPHDGWWISPHQFVVDANGCAETYDYRSPVLPLRARILHRCLADAAAVLPVSDAFADLHRAAGLDRVSAVPNGVSAMTPIPRRPAPDDRVRLALIGGAARHKGFMLLRQAIEAGGFKRLHLTIVDHGQLPGTERKAIWGSTPVRFIPMCRQSQVAALYAQIDVLVAPSIWPESFGLVTREALQCGLWVIASDRGAIGRDVVEGKNGHIVDVSDDAGLMAALSRVDAQPEVYRQSPPQGLPLRSAADQVDDLVRVYREILRLAKD
jgi:glycosyltransferase involved in cell wall biosynthesis